MKLNSLGFSLVELMVGGAILAGIGLTGAQLMKGQKKTQTMIDNDLELDLIHSKITAMFSENAKDCDATFRHLYGTNLATPITQIKRCTSTGCANRELDASSIPAAAVNAVVFGTGVSAPALSDRTLWYIESFGAITPHNGQAAARTNLMILPVNYAHRTFTNRRITKFATIAMRFNSAGAFRQCLDGSTSTIHNISKEVCNFLGRPWDGENNRCAGSGVDVTCPKGSAYRGFVGTGTGLSQCVSTEEVAAVPIRPSVPNNGISSFIYNDTTSPAPCAVLGHMKLNVRLHQADGNRITFVCQ